MPQRIAEKYIGKPCKYGHSGLRYKSNFTCVKCSEEQQLIRRPLKEHTKTEKQLQIEAGLKGNVYISSSQCNKGHIGERYIHNGGCKICSLARSKVQRENYTEEERKRYNEAGNNWRVRNKNNPLFLAKRTASQMKREVSKISATPPWANLEEIQSYYTFAKYLEELSGTKFHVDHIVPLRSKIVCGLHVEYNLQILPAIENIKKGNKLMEQGECTNLSATSIMNSHGGGIIENSRNNN